MSGDRHVAVVGGGIAGLAAAHAIIEGGARVTLFEAGNRLGGMILTTPFAGHPQIDEGADAFLARVPWAVDLARKVSLGDSLTSPSTGKAAVWWNGLHDIPEGLLLGLPTNLLGLARSRLLSRRGKVRAAMEMLRPRTDTYPDAIGKYVRSRFGNEVHERLVDPLIGSIYAADTDDFSLAAVPQLAEIAEGSRSVLLAARRRAPTPPGPIFYAPSAGVGALVDAVSVAVTTRGGDVRSNAAISELALDGQQWRVDGESFDRVVLACPARAASGLLSTLAPSVAATLDGRPDRWRCPVDVGDTGRRVAAAPARPVGLSRTEAAAAAGHRGLVRIAEMGSLGQRRPRRRSNLAGPRRAAGVAPLRRRPGSRCNRRDQPSSQARCAADSRTCQPVARCVPAVPAPSWCDDRDSRGVASAWNRSRRRQLPRNRHPSVHPLRPTGRRSDVAALILNGRLWHAA